MQSLRYGSFLTVIALLTSGTACTFVNGETFLEKEACIDEDGDGYPLGNCPADAPYELAGVTRDCNDVGELGPLESPGLDEIPYDGLNNDCSGGNRGPNGDLLDKDEDGYAGISYADYEKVLAEVHPHLDIADVWPSSLSKTAVDCNDDDGDIHPDQVEPVWYDGVDGNCDGLDDWDQDADGFVPSPDLLREGSLPYPGELPAGDCDDTRADVHPFDPEGDNTPDVYYDGVDHDCAGDNDFDADGDGFMPDRTEGGSNIAPLFTAYQNKYGYSFDADFGDCDDDDDAIFPGQHEIWYDGVDSDCQGDDDFDGDKDGWIPGEYATVYETYASAPWFLDLQAGDCHDTNPEVHPGVLEHLGDELDQDCDGDLDTTAFAFGDYEWSGPRPPIVLRDDHNYLLTTVASELIDGSTVQSERGLVFAFSPEDADWMASPTRVQAWHTGSGMVPGDRFDVVPFPDGFGPVLSARQQSGNSQILWFRKQVWDEDRYTNKSSHQDYDNSTAPTYTDIDIRLNPDDPDEWFIFGCAPTADGVTGGVHFMRMVQTSSAASAVIKDWSNEIEGGEVCWLSFDDNGAPLAHVFSFDTGTRVYGIDLSANPTNGRYNLIADSADDLVYEANNEGVLQVWAGCTEATGGTGDPDCASGFSGVTVLDDETSYPLLDADSTDSETDYTAYSADVSWVGSNLFVVAVVEDLTPATSEHCVPPGNNPAPDWCDDGIPDVVLAYGDPNGEMTDVVLPYEHPRAAQSPEHATIVADAERVFIAVASSGVQTGDEDAVGWLFMGPPE